ncbi:hypothetical protein K503DRAFT_863006 [Rhizopogon vinicolor AM-OR11-026]|uniref:Uncharacterized protein n=1 Tax=Rhizopogon vinicolor AM-OR11-026 TaxID=1314800 RepID=A0A1B7NC85_9AGAM|nr:hypothetical protein K503DRAFT_863006 [Rhizopogon vinicolor AM-OR11-026]
MPERGRTRIRKEQKEEKENVQPTRIGPNLTGIPFLNSAFSPPLQDLLNNLPTAPPIDTVNPPSWLEADLFLDANESDAQPISVHTKKYRGHRVLPDSILAELEEAEI